LTGKKYGQFIRLPGRHHKRPHWTRVWDGATDDRDTGLLRGDAAIRAILRSPGQPVPAPSSPLVPPDFILPCEIATPGIRDRQVDPEALDRDAALARDALDYLGEDYYEDYDWWVKVGMALRQLGDQGLELWHEWAAQSRSLYRPEDLDAKWPTFQSATESPLVGLSNRPFLIGLGSLFAWAKQEGWKPPEKKSASRSPRRRWSFSIDL
jgi:hypothetical protein